MTERDRSFADQFIDMVDAMRLVAHNAMRGDSVFTCDEDGEGMDALQCMARIDRSDGRLVVSVQPIEGIGDAFVPMRVVLREDRFPGSPLFSVQPSAEGALFQTFSGLFRHFEEGGSANLLGHMGMQYGVITARMLPDDDRRNDLIRDLAIGTASIVGDSMQVLIRHPAFGSKGEAVCVDHEGSILPIPDGGKGIVEAAQAERIRMISGMMGQLVESVRATRTSEGVFDLSPMAYTYAPATDPSTARRNAMAAYARLHATRAT